MATASDPTPTSFLSINQIANTITLKGSNPQPDIPDPAFADSFMTLQLVVLTIYREIVYQSSTGEIDFVHDFGSMGLPPETSNYRFPVTYLAQPAVLEKLLSGALEINNFDLLTPPLLSYALRGRVLCVEARVEVFNDRWIDEEDQGLADLVKCLRILEREEGEGKMIEKLKENGGVEFDGNEREEEELGTCSVCLEDLCGKMIRMHCSHLYHGSCILSWLEKKNSCPLCRKQLL